MKSLLPAVLWFLIALLDITLKRTRSDLLIWKENYILSKDLAEIAIKYAKKQDSSTYKDSPQV